MLAWVLWLQDCSAKQASHPQIEGPECVHCCFSVTVAFVVLLQFLDVYLAMFHSLQIVCAEACWTMAEAWRICTCTAVLSLLDLVFCWCPHLVLRRLTVERVCNWLSSTHSNSWLHKISNLKGCSSQEILLEFHRPSPRIDTISLPILVRCKAQIGDGQWSTRLWIQSRTAWDLRNTSSVGQSQSLLNQEYFCPELSTFVILHCPCYHTLNSCDAVLQVFALDETHSWSKFQSNCESVWGPMFCEISWGLANSTCHINKYHFACMPRFLMKCNPFICWAEIDTRIEVLFNQWFCSKNSGNGMSGILLQFMWSCPVYSVYFQWNGDTTRYVFS